MIILIRNDKLNKKNIIEFIRFIFFLLLLLLIITSSILITYNVMNLKTYSYWLEGFGIVGLVIYIVDKIKNCKFNKYEIFIFILMVLSSLSLFTAMNLQIALFGKINRYEGLFVILTYYIIMLNGIHVKNKKYINIIVCFILFFYLLNIIYGLFQVKLIPRPSFIKIVNSWKYARGFFGNSMFYGSLSTICYPITLMLFLNSKSLGKKMLMFLILILSSLGVVISGAMSVYVTCGFIYLFLLAKWIYELVKKKKNFKFLFSWLLALVIFIASLLFFVSQNKYLKKDFVELGNESQQIMNGNIQSNFGTGRIYIWKNTMNKILENKGLGVGIDNFAIAFKGKLIDTKSGLMVDKAHNDYLQKMLCEGVLAGICYFGFLLFIFLEGLSFDYSSRYYGLYLSFIAYCVHIFFGISVTRVAPIFFIVLGLLISNLKEKNKNL